MLNKSTLSRNHKIIFSCLMISLTGVACAKLQAPAAPHANNQKVPAPGPSASASPSPSPAAEAAAPPISGSSSIQNLVLNSSDPVKLQFQTPELDQQHFMISVCTGPAASQTCAHFAEFSCDKASCDAQAQDDIEGAPAGAKRGSITASLGQNNMVTYSYVDLDASVDAGASFYIFSNLDGM